MKYSSESLGNTRTNEIDKYNQFKRFSIWERNTISLREIIFLSVFISRGCPFNCLWDNAMAKC
jgi:radical SAM superfamily enzyme YgiQ (UPF0313 family)